MATGHTAVAVGVLGRPGIPEGADLSGRSADDDRTPAGQPHVCQWWLIRSFDNLVRRLVQNPQRILAGLVRRGDACLDLGCGIGYFTIPMADMVGPSGSVTAVDLQPRMLAGVRRRARQAGLLDRIRLHEADASGMHLEGSFDFALAFWMVHEAPDPEALFGRLHLALRPAGRLLLVEPKGHVRRVAFERTVSSAERAGFLPTSRSPGPVSRAVLLTNGPGTADAGGARTAGP